jgi:hypothetical protein
MAREVLMHHFGDKFKPAIEGGHNSADLRNTIADNAATILEERVLLKSPVKDAQVSSFLACFC